MTQRYDNQWVNTEVHVDLLSYGTYKYYACGKTLSIAKERRYTAVWDAAVSLLPDCHHILASTPSYSSYTLKALESKIQGPLPHHERREWRYTQNNEASTTINIIKTSGRREKHVLPYGVDKDTNTSFPLANARIASRCTPTASAALLDSSLQLHPSPFKAHHGINAPVRFIIAF